MQVELLLAGEEEGEEPLYVSRTLRFRPVRAGTVLSDVKHGGFSTQTPLTFPASTLRSRLEIAKPPATLRLQTLTHKNQKCSWLRKPFAGNVRILIVYCSLAFT